MSLSIGDSVQRFGDNFFGWLPRLVGALVILVIAILVAKVVRKLLLRVLPKTGMDRAVHSGTHGQYVARYASGFQPSALIAAIVYWLILLFGITLAISTLGIQALNNFLAVVVGYLPNVIAAILILVVAIALAGVIAGVVTKLMGDTALGKIVAAVAPVLILTIAVFMALVQLRIAVPIVTGAFYITLGAIALGAALAFGLGGRGAAQRMIDSAYEKGQAAAPQMKEEMALAKDRAQERAQQAKGAAEEKRAEVEGGAPGGAGAVRAPRPEGV
jgi:hypothetical protein